MLLDKDNIRKGKTKNNDKPIVVGNNTAKENKGTILGFNVARDCVICDEPFILDEINDTSYMCPRCTERFRDPVVKAKVREIVLGK